MTSVDCGVLPSSGDISQQRLFHNETCAAISRSYTAPFCR